MFEQSELITLNVSRLRKTLFPGGVGGVAFNCAFAFPLAWAFAAETQLRKSCDENVLKSFPCSETLTLPQLQVSDDFIMICLYVFAKHFPKAFNNSIKLCSLWRANMSKLIQ